MPSWEGEKLGTAVGDGGLLRSSSARRGRTSGLRVEILSSGGLPSGSRSRMSRPARAARSTSGINGELGPASAEIVEVGDSRGETAGSFGLAAGLIWVFRVGNELRLDVDDVDEFGELW